VPGGLDLRSTPTIVRLHIPSVHITSGVAEWNSGVPSDQKTIFHATTKTTLKNAQIVKE